MRINFSTLNIFSSKINVKNNNDKQAFSSLRLKAPLAADKFERTNAPVTNPLSFLGRTDREPTDFEIRLIPNIKCPVCEQTTMTNEQIEEFKQNVYDKKGQELVDALEKYGSEAYWLKKPVAQDRTVYRGELKGSVEIIKKLARENPEYDLQQIVQTAAKTSMPELINEQLKVIDEIKDYEKRNITNHKEATRLNAILDENVYKILGAKPDERFKRKTLIKQLEGLYLYNLLDKKQILEIVQKLPNSTTSGDSFFVKYSNRNRSNEEIAERLVIQNRATGEHLKCFSDNGANAIENYVVDCGYCNGVRGDTKFLPWAKSVPGFEEKYQEYLDDVQGYIDEGRLSDEYDDYPQKIIKTFKKLSDGEIRLIDPKEHIKHKKSVNDEIIEPEKTSSKNYDCEVLKKYLINLKSRKALLEEQIDVRNAKRYSHLTNGAYKKMRLKSEKELENINRVFENFKDIEI